jgi:hypothetical protein
VQSNSPAVNAGLHFFTYRFLFFNNILNTRDVGFDFQGTPNVVKLPSLWLLIDLLKQEQLNFKADGSVDAVYANLNAPALTGT